MATSQLDLEALEAEIGRFLGGVAVAEGTGAKLQRLLRGFLERELLPLADRAAGMGWTRRRPAASPRTSCVATPTRWSARAPPPEVHPLRVMAGMPARATLDATA
jgi:hypothetical protein